MYEYMYVYASVYVYICISLCGCISRHIHSCLIAVRSVRLQPPGNYQSLVANNYKGQSLEYNFMVTKENNFALV